MASRLDHQDPEVDLSVVIPAFNPGPELIRCVGALQADSDGRDEIIVVDDGSDDNLTADLAGFRVRLVCLKTNAGRGPARNAGWLAARGSLILFVDADVEVHPGTISRVRKIAADNPDWVCFFGSYDDAPADPALVSQYRNLLHHFTHQQASCTARHFWPGLGAMHRHVLESLGGFDEGRWARDMEEVDLGARLVAAGHTIHVVQDLQAKHLKAYGMISMIRTDLLQRAWPWSVYLLEHKFVQNDFVLSLDKKISALSTLAIFAGVMLGVGHGVDTGAATAGSGFLLFGIANRRFGMFLINNRGLAFTLACVPLHLFHVLCSVTGFALALFGFRPRVNTVFSRLLPSSR